jgi:hypothetical protein
LLGVLVCEVPMEFVDREWLGVEEALAVVDAERAYE